MAEKRDSQRSSHHSDAATCYSGLAHASMADPHLSDGSPTAAGTRARALEVKRNSHKCVRAKATHRWADFAQPDRHEANGQRRRNARLSKLRTATPRFEIVGATTIEILLLFDGLDVGTCQNEGWADASATSADDDHVMTCDAECTCCKRGRTSESWGSDFSSWGASQGRPREEVRPVMSGQICAEPG